MELNHPALQSSTGVAYLPYYRDLNVAAKMGKSENDWWAMPY